MVDISRLNDENLVYEFSRPFSMWIVISLFVSLPLRNERCSWISKRVLAHLKSCSAGLHEDTLVLSYLECMIETNEKSLDVEFHNELVHQYGYYGEIL